MPKVRAPQGLMTVQEAARKLSHDGHATSSPDSIAVTLRTACLRGDIWFLQQPIGPIGGRVAKLVRYDDVRDFWLGKGR